jgi:hypothetical protein
MKQIRLSGREAAVIRAIGFGLPATGSELLHNTNILPEDLADVLCGLMDAGYVESDPIGHKPDAATVESLSYEMNSAYTHELRAALARIRR